MIVASYTNEVNNTKTELHQIASSTFEVKRYYTKINGVDLVLRNEYYFDNLVKATELYNTIK